MRKKRENGVALITTLLILFLVSALVVGMSWMVMSDQRLGGNNQSRETAFYGAEAGMEKMTADMGNIFGTKGAITSGDITSITSAPPSFPGIQYQNSVGTSTYQIGCPDPTVVCTNPGSQSATIQPPSPYAGMQGLITPFTLQVAAQTTTGSEIKLRRQVQLVAIPVFQFGIFSNTDLSFFAGPQFTFGGRVHTNGNLWISANSGPLYLGDKVTVVGQVIRNNLENGYAISGGGDYSGTVNLALTPTVGVGVPADWRPVLLTEGSATGSNVYGAVSTTPNTASWTNGVLNASNGMMTTGVQSLNLISTALGGLQTPVALIRRPVVGELLANPAQFNQRYFSNTQASLRILLDDYGSDGTCGTSDMLKLDTVSATVPVNLATLANIPTSGGGAAGTNYSAANGYWQSVNSPTITGCLKIEVVTAAGAATDVTTEILNLGYLGRNMNPLINPAPTGPNQTYVAPPQLPVLPAAENQVPASSCADVSPNAVVRIARLRDNPSVWPGAGDCGSGANSRDYWPNVLYDSREGVTRPTITPSDPTLLTAAGVMYYIELDVANLDKWFMGTLGASGNTADGVGGYEVYFSDRRGNAVDPINGIKEGALGFNDIVNPASADGCPNGILDGGEDLESDGNLRVYGGTAIALTNLLKPGAAVLPNLLANTYCPGLPATDAILKMYAAPQEARENPPVFFRHALKLVHGSVINLGTVCYGPAPQPPCGLTVASENPVYIQGDYNAPGGSLTGAGTVAASVAGDTVTLLSDSWNDVNTFITPYDEGARDAVQTSYRVALIAGKGIPFAQPAGQPEDFGTDGGLHNFLRFLENWGSINCNYEGSLVSFYYNRQGVGLYKTNSYVYSPPNRNYSFDTNFTQGPQWLPPRTPTLRSINTIGFTQMLSPTQ